jgi:hypothetical protein
MPFLILKVLSEINIRRLFPHIYAGLPCLTVYRPGLFLSSPSSTNRVSSSNQTTRIYRNTGSLCNIY